MLTFVWPPTIALVLAIVFGGISILFYAATLSTALKRCSWRNRFLSPGIVWLLVIPVFGLAWQFVVVAKLAESLRNEFASRGISEAKPVGAERLGLVMSVLAAAVLLPYIREVAAAAWFVCWLVYWTRIAMWSRQLAEPRLMPA